MKFQYLTIALILLLSTANAELTLINPPQNSTNEINIFKGQNATIDINIQNTGTKTITNIVPETDLNAVFHPTGFGLDPGKTKKITATIHTNENTTGTISFGEQSFRIKIKIIEAQTVLDLIQEKYDLNKDMLYTILLMASTTVIALLLMRKVK